MVLDPTPPVPIVRAPAVVTGVPLSTLRGLLLGPGDIPIANARVEYPALQRTVTTTAQGEFVLRAIPAEPRTKTLHIKAKHKTFDLAVEQPTNPEGVVTIQIPLSD